MEKEEISMSISLEEAKGMMNENSIEKLKSFVSTTPTINMENKVNCDILMQALCRAVSEDIIHVSSLDEKIIKLLNSSTNTLSPSKLGDILSKIRVSQPNIICKISMLTHDMSKTLYTWKFTGPVVKFNNIFETVVNEFNITPSIVRTKMTETLKPTIVNNVSQLLSRYESAEDKTTINISINTITRLVNMEDHLLFAEFVEEC